MKSFSIVPNFCLPLLFSHANNIKTNIAVSIIKPVIEYLPFGKTDRFDSEISYKKI